ncbi:MAG: hypothetical protein KKH08_02780 [Candidatus Omnitrophica bacterium]|nr:hypothetical protein [Candidatus Omnitrophota bacterium]
MFFRIVGILWILLGIWWMMRPQRLQRVFVKKARKTRKKIMLVAMVIAIGLFFSAAKYASGILANVLLIFGIIGIVKAILFFTTDLSDKVIDWWLKKPLWVWRVWAGCFTLMGLLFQRVG